MQEWKSENEIQGMSSEMCPHCIIIIKLHIARLWLTVPTNIHTVYT